MFWVLKILGVVICVPFFTLLERKVLSYSQNRKGPKKVSILGMLQPVADGMKLMIKCSGTPLSAKSVMFFLFPMISFLLTIGFLFFYPSPWNVMFFTLGMVGIVCLSSLGVYTLLGSGWSSNSKYSLLGCMRGAAQVISYEINLIFLVLFPCCIYNKFNLNLIYSNSGSFLFFFLLFFLWVFAILCETNRAPFDFAEGESELVSGFKTEYSSLLFTFLFLSEYGKMMFFSWFLSCLFCLKSNLFFSFVTFFFLLFIFMWSRATLPRFRYDFLMVYSWCMVLPAITLMFWFVMLF